MTYRSLYRRWRPNRFSEVAGQEHITRTLSQALSRENISHAYLFCGPRGNGKTSVAKIMAKAVNCHYFPGQEPCGSCKPCVEISRGTFMDVLELDAASNRGIEEVRELREKSRYATSEGRYSVYIIDEAHMLTHEAFNALLKTLEEPPPRVVFMLATTEPSKLPSTVISRCQRFDFRLLSEQEITDRLQEVAEAEHWDCRQEALHVIARLSEGAMRDALGLLEQCQAYADGEITMEHVYDLTGLPPEETLGKLLDALVQQDIPAGLQAIREVTYGGKDLHLFVKEQLYLFTRLLVAQSTGEKSVDLQEGAYRELVSQYLKSISHDALMEVISLLHQLSSELKFYQNPHFYLEIAFINMIKSLRRLGNASVDDLLWRVEQLEEKLHKVTEAGLSWQEAASESSPGNACSLEITTEKTGFEENSHSEKTTEDTAQTEKSETGVPSSSSHQEEDQESSRDIKQEVRQDNNSSREDVNQETWAKVLKTVEKKQPLLLGLVEKARPVKLENSALTLAFSREDSFYQDMLMEKKRRSTLERLVSEIMGNNVSINTVLTSEEKEVKETDQVDRLNHTLSQESVEKSNGQDTITDEKPSPVSPGEEEPEDSSSMSNEALKLFNGKVINTEE